MVYPILILAFFLILDSTGVLKLGTVFKALLQAAAIILVLYVIGLGSLVWLLKKSASIEEDISKERSTQVINPSNTRTEPYSYEHQNNHSLTIDNRVNDELSSNASTIDSRKYKVVDNPNPKFGYQNQTLPAQNKQLYFFDLLKMYPSLENTILSIAGTAQSLVKDRLSGPQSPIENYNEEEILANSCVAHMCPDNEIKIYINKNGAIAFYIIDDGFDSGTKEFNKKLIYFSNLDNPKDVPSKLYKSMETYLNNPDYQLIENHNNILNTSKDRMGRVQKYSDRLIEMVNDVADNESIEAQTGDFKDLDTYAKPAKFSFECNSSAKSKAQLLICTDNELFELDVKLANEYREAKLKVLDKTELEKQKNEALKWVEFNCQDKRCVLGWYVKRFSELEKIIRPEFNKTKN